MLIEKKIKAMIESHDMINDSDKILLALSGGSDSCVLLFCLIRQYPNNKIYAAHLNHMIRGNDADKDEEFVRALCAEYNIKLFVERKNIPEIASKTKKTLEEAARDERYLFFNKICGQIGGNNIKIATAHNASDNTETVIFNMSRGCGTEGLCGIAPVFSNIIRPLLSCTKEEILEYCVKNKIKYVEDKTNTDEIYTRNFIRHSIAKSLKSRFFRLDENISKMTELVQADTAFIDEYVRDFMKQNSITDSVDIDVLLNINKAVRSRVIKKIYDIASGLNNGLEYKHLQYIEETIKSRENKRINLPKNIVAEVSYGRLILIKESSTNILFDYNQELKQGTNNITGTNIDVCTEYRKNIEVDEIMGVSRLKKSSNLDKINKTSENVYNLFNHAYIDFDKIKGTVYIRNRHINDEYIFFGQTKSVKKNYINYKIPVGIRDILPILYDSNGIIWACGLPVGDRVKITDKTKNIIDIKIILNEK